MRIGDLRHRVEIEEYTMVLDPMGQEIGGWEAVATVWAAVEPLKGREYWEARALQAETTARVRIRYRPDLTGKDYRLIFRGQTYDIESIINVDGRDRELVLMCRVKEG